MSKTTDQHLREIEDLRIRLARAEETLAAIRNGQGDALIVCDARGRLTFASAAARQAAGLDPAGADLNFSWDVWGQWCAPDGRPIAPDKLPVACALRGEVVAGRELHIVRANGATYDILLNATPLRDAGGQIIGVVASFSDITSRKRTGLSLQQANENLEAAHTELTSQNAELLRVQESLHENQEHLHMALAAANAGTWEWDLETNDSTWSVETFLLYGLEPYTVQPSYQAWRQIVHPQDRALVEKTAQEAARNGTELTVEFRVDLPDDQERWLLSRARPLHDANGRVTRYMGIVLDITERKQAEQDLHRSLQRIELLAGTVSELLYSRQPQKVVESLCRRVMAHLDCHVFFNFLVDEKAGRLHLNACAGIPGEETRRIEWIDYGTAVSGCAARDNCCILAEHVPTTPDARTELVKSYGVKAYVCHPLVRPDGQVLGTLSFGTRSRDTFSQDDLSLIKAVTDHVATAMSRMAAEQQLKQFNQHLEQLVAERTAVAEHRANQLRALAGQLTQAEQRERRRLASILHDQLQQLLVAAKFNTRILHAQLPDDSLRRQLLTIDELLDQSLNTSRTLTIELSPPILSTGDLPAALHWLARQMHDKHRLNVRVHADEHANPVSDEVRSLLFQAARELLFNVVKHAHAGQATVEMAPADNHAVRLTVADSGQGFDPTHAVGTAFSASDSGFGLFSIRERVELIGGHMEIDSTPGEGTRIHVTAPLNLNLPTVAADPVARTTTPVLEIPPPPAPTLAELRSRIRVLLADDHTVVRNGLIRLLQLQPDMEVVGQASDGRQAVDMALQLQPDVVVMDVTMPTLDGLEATRLLRYQVPTARVIGLSMHASDDMAEAMTRAGAIAYLAKTSPPETLIAAIRTIRPTATC